MAEEGATGCDHRHHPDSRNRWLRLLTESSMEQAGQEVGLDYKLSDLPPSQDSLPLAVLCLPKVSWHPKTVPEVGIQVFKCMNTWATIPIMGHLSCLLYIKAEFVIDRE